MERISHYVLLTLTIGIGSVVSLIIALSIFEHTKSYTSVTKLGNLNKMEIQLLKQLIKQKSISTKKYKAVEADDLKLISEFRMRTVKEMPSHVNKLFTIEQVRDFVKYQINAVRKMRNVLIEHGEVGLAHHHLYTQNNADKSYRFVILCKRLRDFKNSQFIEKDIGLKRDAVTGKTWKKKRDGNKNDFKFFLYKWFINSTLTHKKESKMEEIWALGMFNPQIVGFGKATIDVKEFSSLCKHSSYETVRNETVWVRYQTIMGDWSNENAPIVTMEIQLDGVEAYTIQRIIEEMEHPEKTKLFCKKKKL